MSKIRHTGTRETGTSINESPVTSITSRSTVRNELDEYRWQGRSSQVASTAHIHTFEPAGKVALQRLEGAMVYQIELAFSIYIDKVKGISKMYESAVWGHKKIQSPHGSIDATLSSP